MDSCDEKLTLENVDEQVEQLLSLPQEFEPSTMIPLARTVRNLQSIYEEDRRLEQVWARIKSHVPRLSADSSINLVEEMPTSQPVLREGKTIQNPDVRSFNSILRRPNKQSQQPFRWNWSNLGIGIIAALMLITFFTWPIWSYAFHSLQAASTQPATKVAVTPQLQPTVNLPGMKEYVGPYFKLQYPVNWKITSVNTRDTSPYLQTVQFRPLATSSVEVNVDAMPDSNYSSNQLLHMDPDVKLGTLLNTSTVTYHGIPWTVGVVELADSTHTQMSKFEVAYSNQGVPHRIEFDATPDMFNLYSKVFDSMFASFYSQTSLAVTPTATPSPATIPAATATPAITATPALTATPTPTTNTSDIKEYISQYFKIQYPANWVITNVATEDGYRQTVQFHPSVTSSVFVNVSVMNSNNLSSNELLLTDPDVKLGTLLSTSTVTYHGIPWTVGIINLVNSTQAQVAYSNLNAPYKIEFGAPQDTFSSNMKIFNAMFASFYPAS